MKLELKHLAPYLPYKLTGEVVDFEENTNTIDTLDQLCVNDNIAVFKRCIDVYLDEPNETSFKPILRPLSELDKSHIDYMYFEIISTDSDMYGSRYEFQDFIDETDLIHLPYCLFDYLLEHHFDVFGLIDKCLASDINTL